MSIGLQQASSSLPTLDEVRAAAEIVYRLMQPTPQYRWPQLCSRLGTEVWVKHENHTPIAAFKARTAIVYTEKLLQREPPKKVEADDAKDDHHAQEAGNNPS